MQMASHSGQYPSGPLLHTTAALPGVHHVLTVPPVLPRHGESSLSLPAEAEIQRPLWLLQHILTIMYQEIIKGPLPSIAATTVSFHRLYIPVSYISSIHSEPKTGNGLWLPFPVFQSLRDPIPVNLIIPDSSV